MLSFGTFLPASEGSAVPEHCCSVGSAWPRTIGCLSWRRKGIKLWEPLLLGGCDLSPQGSLEQRAVRVIPEDLWAVYLRLKWGFFLWEGRGIKSWNYRFWHNLRNFFGYCHPFSNYFKGLWALFYSWNCVSLPGRALQLRAAGCFLHLAVNIH